MEADGNALMIKSDGKTFELFLAGAENIDAKVYNMSGSLALTDKGYGDTLTLDASVLSPGAYIVNVNGIHTRKIIVRQ